MAYSETSLLHAASGISEEIVLSIEGIPPGFEIRADGIYEVANGTDPLRLSSPLVVMAAFEDPAGRNRGRIMVFEDDLGRKQKVSRHSAVRWRAASR